MRLSNSEKEEWSHILKLITDNSIQVSYLELNKMSAINLLGQAIKAREDFFQRIRVSKKIPTAQFQIEENGNIVIIPEREKSSKTQGS